MKPDYALRDPKGWCGDPKRGAALGRPGKVGDKKYRGKIGLYRVALDSGGYDRLGTYFGIGGPLYWYVSLDEDQTIEGHLRASGRTEAKKKIREEYPLARFNR